MNKFRVLDLFSGIGGFSLGLERTGGFETVAFCEIDQKNRQVLAKHWPKVCCHDDISTFHPEKTDVVCGGFPCQDISTSGTMAGLSGPRSGLWGEMARVVAAGVTKHHVISFWKKQPFDLRLPIVKGRTVGGNCRKCMLKSEADIAAEIRDDADDDWPDRMEAKTGHTFSKRYSHREMRDFMSRQGDWALSTEGVLCQANDGECT